MAKRKPMRKPSVPQPMIRTFLMSSIFRMMILLYHVL
jgi:hypothetical protein